jgi:hypothetical protein
VTIADLANEAFERSAALWTLNDRKRDFELALLEMLEARNGGDQHLKVAEVLTVAEVEGRPQPSGS